MFSCHKDLDKPEEKTQKSIYQTSLADVEKAIKLLPAGDERNFFDFKFADANNTFLQSVHGERNQNELINAFCLELIRQNKTHHFANALITQLGYPLWSHTKIVESANSVVGSMGLALPLAHLTADSCQGYILGIPLDTMWYFHVVERNWVDSLIQSNTASAANPNLRFHAMMFYSLDQTIFNKTNNFLKQYLINSQFGPTTTDDRTICVIATICEQPMALTSETPEDRCTLHTFYECFTGNGSGGLGNWGAGDGNSGNGNTTGTGGGGGASNTPNNYFNPNDFEGIEQIIAVQINQFKDQFCIQMSSQALLDALKENCGLAEEPEDLYLELKLLMQNPNNLAPCVEETIFEDRQSYIEKEYGVLIEFEDMTSNECDAIQEIAEKEIFSLSDGLSDFSFQDEDQTVPAISKTNKMCPAMLEFTYTDNNEIRQSAGLTNLVFRLPVNGTMKDLTISRLYFTSENLNGCPESLAQKASNALNLAIESATNRISIGDFAKFDQPATLEQITALTYFQEVRRNFHKEVQKCAPHHSTIPVSLEMVSDTKLIQYVLDEGTIFTAFSQFSIRCD